MCEEVVYVVSEWGGEGAGFLLCSIYGTRGAAEKERKRLRDKYGGEFVVEPWSVRGKEEGHGQAF